MSVKDSFCFGVEMRADDGDIAGDCKWLSKLNVMILSVLELDRILEFYRRINSIVIFLLDYCIGGMHLTIH